MFSRDRNGRSVVIFAAAVLIAIGATALLMVMRGHDGQPIQPIGEDPPQQDPSQPTEQTSGISMFVGERTSDRQELDRTVWSDEVAAQRYEEPFVQLWDNLRTSSDKVGVLAAFPFEKLVLSTPASSQQHEFDIESIRFDDGELELTPGEWRQWLDDMHSDGFQLVQSEWHHSRFEPDPAGARSVVSMSLDVTNEPRQTRYSIKGDLVVHWEADRIVPRTIETRQLKVLSRQGEPAFREALVFDREDELLDYLPMVMAYDLNDDGLSEIVVPSTNAVYWNRGNLEFERAPLVNGASKDEVLCGLLADLTGDRQVDLLAAVKTPQSSGGMRSNLILFSATEDGGLSEAASNVVGDSILYHPMVITAGDIDADGDLDVFVGQYKSPYKYGQMPTPYYDANDGYPAQLLRNDGQGGFVDVTEQAGLAAKRQRRTYSASFVDLDADGDLDLAVASDFSGLDLYQNDGSGAFIDVTDKLVDNRHSFGMALTFGDYDLNSKLDFLMVGMSSTTARRLDQLGLGREEFPEHQEFRREMGYGNRMYLSDGETFKQPAFNDQVARTGWSWGATSFDFDNDGDRDIYIANGHVSGHTCKDYCTTFWRHDIYEGSSQEDPLMQEFFKTNIAKELKPISWDGFEHNVLLANQRGQGFLSIGFLAGVATEFDSRNVISDDLDGDGRMDLIVVARENARTPFAVRVFENRCPSKLNWIGLRLENTPGSGLGARVTVKTPGETVLTDVVACGDSLKSQHAPVVHFGLGSVDTVEEVTVQWPQAKPLRIENPAVNRYHRVSAPQ